MFSKFFKRNYDKIYQHKDYLGEARELATALMDGSVLDVGCGTGRHAQHLQELGFAVDGLEPEAMLAEQAAARINGTVYQGRIEDFEPEKQYDNVIAMFQVFNFTTDNDAAFKKVSESLRPGGMFIFEILNPSVKVRKFGFDWSWKNFRIAICDRKGDKFTLRFVMPFKLQVVKLIFNMLDALQVSDLTKRNGFTCEGVIRDGINIKYICKKNEN